MKMNGQGYLKGFFGIKLTRRNHKAGSPSICQTYARPPASIQLGGHNNIKAKRAFQASHSLPCVLTLRGTLADVSSFHTFLAGFIHQPPSFLQPASPLL